MFTLFSIIKFRDSRNYLPELVSLDEDLEDISDTLNSTISEGARRLAKGGGGAGGSGGGTAGGIVEGDSPIIGNILDPSEFINGTFIGDFLDFTERKIWKIALLGFLHTTLLITGSIKVILFLKIYHSF